MGAPFPSQFRLVGEEKAFSLTVHNFPKNQLKIHLPLPEVVWGINKSEMWNATFQLQLKPIWIF